MSAQELKSDDYRPCFSGHETFPLRYGWLQKAYRAVSEAPSAKDAVHVFRDPDSIARFGVGLEHGRRNPVLGNRCRYT